MRKFISSNPGLFLITLSTLGIIQMFFPGYSLNSSIISNYFHFIHLGYGFDYDGVFYNYWGNVSFYNFFFLILTMLSGYLLIKSETKPKRLALFSLSIIFLQSIFFVINTIAYILFYFPSSEDFSILTTILFLIEGIISFATGYISYLLLKKLTANEEVQHTVKTRNDQEVVVPILVHGNERGTHYFVDIIVCILSLSTTYPLFMRINILNLNLSKFEENAINFSLMLFTYYLILELLFKSTPGKYLKANRVTDSSLTTIKWNKILIRTLSRFIPLEPFSFLSDEGWHDRISKTHVSPIKGKKTNFPFSWLIAGFILGFITFKTGPGYFDKLSLNRFDKRMEKWEHIEKTLVEDNAHPMLIKYKGSRNLRLDAFSTKHRYNFEFQNMLSQLTLTKIRAISGNVEWKSDLPLEVKIDLVKKTGNFQIIVVSKKGEPFHSELIFKDSSERLHIYKLFSRKERIRVFKIQ